MTRKFITENADKLARCYDNGGTEAGGSFDQYTVCYTNNFRRYRKDRRTQQLMYVGMSTYPFHPQGFGQHGWSDSMIDVAQNSWGPVSVGRKSHLGTRILFKDLPKDCKQLVVSDLLSLHTTSA